MRALGRWTRVLPAVVIAAAAVAVCSGGGPADDEGSATTVTVTIEEPTTTTLAGPGEGGGTAGDPVDGVTTTDPSTSVSRPDVPVGPIPTIASFTTPGDIDCATGDLQEFTAGWATDGALEVTISIDGLVYDTFPADGTALLPFSCASSHTFELTAIGDGGQTAVRTVTLRPVNASPGSGIRDT